MVLMVIPTRIYKELAILQTEFQSNWYKNLFYKTESQPTFYVSCENVCTPDKNKKNPDNLFRINLNAEYHS
jgi:anaerobic glycerol-3-phosphate dehydrogenase